MPEHMCRRGGHQSYVCKCRACGRMYRRACRSVCVGAAGTSLAYVCVRMYRRACRSVCVGAAGTSLTYVSVACVYVCMSLRASTCHMYDRACACVCPPSEHI